MPSAGLMSAVLLATRLAAASEPTAPPPRRIVAPGQEAILAEMLGRDATLPGNCAFTGGEVNGAVITGRYRCAAEDVVIELRPPGRAPDSVSRTGKFLIVAARGSPPARFVEELGSRIRSRESSFHWSKVKREPSRETQLAPPCFTSIDWVTPCFIVAPIVAILLLAFWHERARRDAGPMAVRLVRRSLVLLFSVGAAVFLAEAAYRAMLRLDTPPPGTSTDFEIYGVGESTLVGEPFEPKISLPRILDHLFGGQIGGRRIVLKNLAERGAPLYPQSVAFEEAVTTRDRRVPGVVLVMSGHNESFPPQFAAAVQCYRPSLVAEKSAIVRDVLLALRRRKLLDRERSLASYEFYLRRVLDTAIESGLTPILATMASNIAGIEPNADASDGVALDAIIRDGIRLEMRGQFAEARDLYVGHLLKNAHTAPSLYYRAGRCEEELGNFAVAREDYWNAVDRDSRVMFGRATRPQNALVSQLAVEYGVPLVDSVAVLEARSPHGILGDDLFMDGQHPTIEGYLLLADAYAEILSRRFDTPIARPLHDEREVAAALGFEAKDLPGAVIDSGSWLIATSVGHPFPKDRMALAAKRFTSLLGQPDEFSAWVGIALSQAAWRGGLLRNPHDIDELGHWLGYARSYRDVPASELPRLVSRLQVLEVDDAVIDHIRQSSADMMFARDPG